MLDVRAGIHKCLFEYHTGKTQSDLGLPCLSWPLVIKNFEHLLYFIINIVIVICLFSES